MSKLLILFFLYSCSQVSVKKAPEEDLVSVDSALNHIHASYMKGCVDTYKEMKMPASFELCRDRAKLHKDQVMHNMDLLP